MTSAEPPRMELERTIEFDKPITELVIDNSSPQNPVLWVFFAEGNPETVLTNTGERHASETTISLRNAARPQRSLRVADLVARADGTDVVVLGNGEEIRRLTGHSTPVTTLTLCPTAGGPLVVSGSEGGTIRIWNPRTGELVRGSQPARVTVLLAYLGLDGRPRIASAGPTGKVRIWNPRLPAPSRAGSVAIRGFNDRVAPDDLLGRRTLADTFSHLLSVDDNGPTVITVEGAWGSGKSTLLDFIRRALATEPEDAPDGPKLTVSAATWMLLWPRERTPAKKTPTKPLVVTFNPWRHQSSEQVWAGLAKAVAAGAEPALMPDQDAKERYWFERNSDRVDRRHLQRQLVKRIYSPVSSLAVIGVAVALLGHLTRMNLWWAWIPAVSIGVAGLLHTAWRFFFARASAFLPGELFAGPVASNAFSSTTVDPLIRDPYYHAKAGYLYLVQHDVKALLEDLKGHGYQVVLLIDDLDRCMPRTTAQVFEAINVFLSDDFPTTRFVLGLDSSVVASHVDHAYKELADAKIVTHPDDPSPGWTFLRKLVQLPVRLPRTTEDNIDNVLLDQLGAVHSDELDLTPLPSSGNGTTTAPAVTEVPEQLVVAMERHHQVRDHLRRRLMAQPEQSVREEKRLLNVWQFYLRVLGSDVPQACHLVAVAEIATRWPAYLHRLRGRWQDLADAVHDDIRWGATIAKLGYGHDDRKAAANLRELLRDCDAQAVAGLANRLF
ncbi:P-loop NTPase fold protein [Lentzea sp. E54]|uniref:P-loop NTPase fold protein n=1 Tax=Lentzea xerophila TaxID=3435883 RepID=UPI003DA26C7B